MINCYHNICKKKVFHLYDFFQGFSRALIKLLFFQVKVKGWEKLKFWIKVYQGLTLINLEVQGKFKVNFFKVKVYISRVNIQFLFKVFSRVTLEIPQNSRQLQGGHFQEFCNLYSEETEQAWNISALYLASLAQCGNHVRGGEK